MYPAVSSESANVYRLDSGLVALYPAKRPSRVIRQGEEQGLLLHMPGEPFFVVREIRVMQIAGINRMSLYF